MKREYFVYHNGVAVINTTDRAEAMRVAHARARLAREFGAPGEVTEVVAVDTCGTTHPFLHTVGEVA